MYVATQAGKHGKINWYSNAELDLSWKSPPQKQMETD